MSKEETYLRAILATVARQTFPIDQLRKLVAPSAGLEKQIAAYNLCNGTRTQAEIVKELQLDKGAFSRTASRWIDLGIVIRVGDGRDSRLLHMYPLPTDSAKKEKRNGRNEGGSSAPEVGRLDEAASP